jgi:dTDP-4-dehydrorhamnose 3,5-epimerase
MIYNKLELDGLVRIAPERITDTRGFFARSFCSEDFAVHGLFSRIAQINTSYTTRKGSIRGLHFQRAPAAEAKTVRCVRGCIFDVAVDLRAGSATYGRWAAEELSAENRNMLYIPEGFGHGFQTLTDDVEMIYLHSTVYAPGFSGGVRHDDPAIGIDWPLPVTEISDKDASLPRLGETEPLSP